MRSCTRLNLRSACFRLQVGGKVKENMCHCTLDVYMIQYNTVGGTLAPPMQYSPWLTGTFSMPDVSKHLVLKAVLGKVHHRTVTVQQKLFHCSSTHMTQHVRPRGAPVARVLTIQAQSYSQRAGFDSCPWSIAACPPLYLPCRPVYVRPSLHLSRPSHLTVCPPQRRTGTTGAC